MKRWLRIALIGTLWLAAFARADERHAASASHESLPRFEAPAPGTYELPPIARVADHQLLDTAGQPTAVLDLAPGEVAFVSFIYLSCPHACPATNAILQKLDRALARRPALAARVRIASVSFDPVRDRPEQMAALERALMPRGRWRFLTAPDEASLQPLLSDYGQDVLRPPTGVSSTLGHVLKVFLVDDTRAIRNVYSTGFLDIRLMLNDAETVLAPAD
jgi:cytochrome oxidase Cu insertion factor (SCO1/SenC/PrrC family)